MDESMNSSHLDQVRGFSLIDVSSEDDCLIFNSSADELHNHQLSEYQEEQTDFEAMDASNVMGTGNTLEKQELVSRPPESLRTRKNGKYNLRKSLAWDSAFFTCEGVLAPEELTCIIEGVETGEEQLLPGIQEGVNRSTDSISTLQSDHLTQEGIQTILFDDIRASIQKSSKPPIAGTPSSKAGSGLTGTQTIPSSRLESSLSKNKPESTSKKSSVGVQGSGKTKKHVSVCPQPISTSRVSATSLPKPPKVGAKIIPIATVSAKRASLGYNRIKQEVNNAKVGAGTVASVAKTPALTGSRRNLPRPAPSVKSSSLGSSNATKLERANSRSSVDSCGSTSSESTLRSPSNNIKRKVGCGTVNPPSSGSTLKVPSRIVSKNKIQVGNSRISAYIESAKKLSSDISPASSISEWSSESTSSTIVSKRSSSSRYTSSCEGIPVESDTSKVLHARSHSNVKSPVGHVPPVTQMQDQRGKNASSGTSTIICPGSAQPSGLRMPSPKIGFFDGVKSSVRTPNGSTPRQPGAPGSLPKIGDGTVSPSEGSNKAKVAKSQSVRSVPTIGNRKPVSQKTATNVKSKSPKHQEPSNASLKISSASRNVKPSPQKSPEIQNKLNSTSGNSNLKAEAVGTEVLNLAEDEIELCFSKFEVKPEVDSYCHAINIAPIHKENHSLSVEVTEDADLKNELHSFCHGIEKETTHDEEQLDGLSRNIGSLDTNMHVEKKLINRSVSLSLCDAISQDDTELDLIAENNGSGYVSKAAVPPNITVSSLDIEIPSKEMEPNFSNLSSSHVENVSTYGKMREDADPENDIPSRCDTPKMDNAHCEDRIDEQTGSLDIQLPMQKAFISEAISPSQCDASCEDSFGVSITPREQLACGKEEESLTVLSVPTPTVVFPTNLGHNAGTRIPLAIKDSFCNRNGLLHISTGMVVVEEKTATLPSSDSTLKESS